MARVFITGFEQLKVNLRNEFANLKFATEEGMVDAAKMIKRSMDTSPPLIPKKIGNLRESWFIVSRSGVKEGNSPKFTGAQGSKVSARHTMAVAMAEQAVKMSQDVEVEFGFSAPYATWVHEMGEDINWTTPGSGPKFFEQALKKKKSDIIKVIQRTALIKGYGAGKGTVGGHVGRTYRRNIQTGQFTK